MQSHAGYSAEYAAATRPQTHSLILGYLMWLLGIFGAHRFYYGKQVSGVLYLFTLGLLGIGWLVDLFLMPSLARDADQEYAAGEYSYDLAWLLLALGGVFGLHRFYQEKWLSGLLYLCTGGLFLLGFFYDWLTLNEQISRLNLREQY